MQFSCFINAVNTTAENIKCSCSNKNDRQILHFLCDRNGTKSDDCIKMNKPPNKKNIQFDFIFSHDFCHLNEIISRTIKLKNISFSK